MTMQQMEKFIKIMIVVAVASILRDLIILGAAGLLLFKIAQSLGMI